MRETALNKLPESLAGIFRHDFRWPPTIAAEFAEKEKKKDTKATTKASRSKIETWLSSEGTRQREDHHFYIMRGK